VELEPRLIDVSTPRRARGVVIVLHGGASRRRTMAVSPSQLSVLRMVPIAHRIANARRHDLAVFRLLNSRRGWDTAPTPLNDVRWALGQAEARLGRRLPVCLVGHSLGGRAALLGAGQPSVRGAVALAPWVMTSDSPRGDIAGKPILIVHGSEDRVASPGRAAQLARRLQTRADVSFVVVKGAGHSMLRHHDEFSRLAADFTTKTLLDPNHANPRALNLPGR